jgi:hypothetical protein
MQSVRSEGSAVGTPLMGNVYVDESCPSGHAPMLFVVVTVPTPALLGVFSTTFVTAADATVWSSVRCWTGCSRFPWWNRR